MNKTPVFILIISGLLITWLISFCNRPDCINSNPIFDKYDPESIEYRKELKSQILQAGQDNLNFWIYRLKRIDGVDYLKLYIQSDNLCAILYAKNNSQKAISKIKKHNMESGSGYSGARLLDVKLKIDTSGSETNFIIEKIGRILD